MLAFAVSGADAQRIEPINKVVDCGQVTYQTPVTAEFEIKNKDNHSIRISNVRTSCGCTSVDYPKGEIVGDAAFMVRVTYDAQTMGRFEKFIDIYTDNGQSPLMLTMRGTVVREVVDFGGPYDFMLGDIKADRNDLEFDDVSRGESSPSRRRTGGRASGCSCSRRPWGCSCAMRSERRGFSSSTPARAPSRSAWCWPSACCRFCCRTRSSSHWRRCCVRGCTGASPRDKAPVRRKTPAETAGVFLFCSVFGRLSSSSPYR